jgi:hypothetical protein
VDGAACGVGVRRAACGGGVRWRRAATECGGACGSGMRRRAAGRGNRFGTMEYEEEGRRQLMLDLWVAVISPSFP